MNAVQYVAARWGGDDTKKPWIVAKFVRADDGYDRFVSTVATFGTNDDAPRLAFSYAQWLNNNSPTPTYTCPCCKQPCAERVKPENTP